MKATPLHIKRLCIAMMGILMVSSCSVRRFIPADERLYKSSDIELQTEASTKDIGAVESELERLLRPSPNSKILGMRLGLLAHYKSQREKPGFLNKYLNKKIGEEPVYLSDIDVDRTVDLINNRLENNGYFDVLVNASIVEEKQLAKVNYNVKLGAPYTLSKYQLDTGSLEIYKEIKTSLEETTLQPGSRFNLDALKTERERIDDHLKSKGYYNFNADFLIFEADTNQYANRQFDLFLRLKKDVPLKSLLPYALNEIYVYPDNSLMPEGFVRDTVELNGINFIQKPEYFRPDRMAPYILFEKGQHYDPKLSRLTSSRLSSIGLYKFVNIRYEQISEADSLSDTLKLNANIFLSPSKKRNLRTELRAVTKSNGFAGPSLALVYSNRNLFRGGETLNISGSLGYEVQVGGGTNQGLSSTLVGLKTDLILPRLIVPFRVDDTFLYAVPKTKVSLGFDFFDRADLYSLNSFNTSFGYSWRKNISVYHEFNPISINYVNTSNITTEFQGILDQNPFLQSSFQQQLITGLTYSFVYNQLANAEKQHPIFLMANLDLAGNILDTFGSSVNENGKKTILDIEYAQYVKADINLVYHYNVGNESKLVSRLFAGVGLPYGNSDALPFAKQYFSGGPSSVRAFRTRSLGPGSYNPSEADQGSFFDRSGDIRLEANVEYRFPIYSYLKGALFADAGNVWLTNENASLPGGKFSSNFINELGAGVGFGLRIDVQNFVIRFDFAAPVSKPYLPDGQRWNFELNETILNFAIGYGF